MSKGTTSLATGRERLFVIESSRSKNTRAWWDCCRMAKSSFLPRRNKGYFGQKVTKTLFGNSPMVIESPGTRNTRKLNTGHWSVGTIFQIPVSGFQLSRAGRVVKLADTQRSGRCGRKVVRVQVPPRPLESALMRFRRELERRSDVASF